MGVGLRATVAVVGAGALLLGGCGSRDGEVERSGSAAPASASAARTDGRLVELSPSGWTLFGVPVSEQFWPAWTRFRMVADGAGQAWWLGPWQLIRLDPLSGDATAWDAADDLQFASTSTQLAPAAGAGVWLIDGSRVRLFDGERFAVDLEVPAEVLNVPEGPESDGRVTDVVEVGSEVWVSVLDVADVSDGQGGCCAPHPGSGGRVARYSDGTWTAMSASEDDMGGHLTVDRDGAVWAAGVILTSSSGDRAAGVPRRWDGRSWSLPGDDGPHAPTEAGDVAADPTGGVWFVSGADGLRRFDGTTWLAPAPDLNSTLNWWWYPGSGTLAVASDGSAWVAGAESLARVSHDGETAVYDRDSGLENVSGLAVGAQDAVVISDVPRVRRLEGDRFLEIWVGQHSTGWGKGHAVSADELWANTQGTWFQLRDGAWNELGAGSGCSVVATDGALWTTTLDATADYPEGGQLARIGSNGYRVLGDGPVDCGYGAAQSPGPDGSVWVLQDGDVVRYWPDGRSESIGHPVGVDPPIRDRGYGSAWEDRVCLHGVDLAGGVWVSEFSYVDDEECTAGTWHRWDGQRWSPADSPDPFTSAQEKVLAGNGVGWLLRYSEEGTELVRYSDGGASTVATRPRMGSLTAVSGGRACVFEYGDRDSIDALAIVCYDAEGERARFDVAGRVSYDSQYSVAADGSIWLLGPQVARLPQTLPAP